MSHRLTYVTKTDCVVRLLRLRALTLAGDHHKMLALFASGHCCCVPESSIADALCHLSLLMSVMCQSAEHAKPRPLQRQMRILQGCPSRSKQCSRAHRLWKELSEVFIDDVEVSPWCGVDTVKSYILHQCAGICS